LVHGDGKIYTLSVAVPSGETLEIRLAIGAGDGKTNASPAAVSPTEVMSIHPQQEAEAV